VCCLPTRLRFWLEHFHILDSRSPSSQWWAARFRGHQPLHRCRKNRPTCWGLMNHQQLVWQILTMAYWRWLNPCVVVFSDWTIARSYAEIIRMDGRTMNTLDLFSARSATVTDVSLKYPPWLAGGVCSTYFHHLFYFRTDGLESPCGSHHDNHLSTLKCRFKKMKRDLI